MPPAWGRCRPAVQDRSLDQLRGGLAGRGASTRWTAVNRSQI